MTTNDDRILRDQVAMVREKAGTEFFEAAVERHQTALRLEHTRKTVAAAKEALDTARDEQVVEVVAAVRAGYQKTQVARAAGVSRVTIDKWLREARR